jgi:ubiquinone/menaquinone biosynthesis C-methylase UbiE
MAKNPNYKASGDPVDFAPDFKNNPEPYGKPIKELLECFDTLPVGAHIIDIAGGYGKYAVPLAEKGFEVTILDCHEVSLAEARRRSDKIQGGGHIKTVFSDVIRNDFPPLNKVDAALCAGFIHHLDKKGVADLFDSIAMTLQPFGLLVLDFSTNKYRRYPDGTPILVDGAPENNCTKEEGLTLLKELFRLHGFHKTHFEIVKLYERQENFWYDADMIVASGVKSQY